MKSENLILLTIFTACLVGCSLLQTTVGPRAAKAINQYCLEPQSKRQLLREEVNSLVAPNSVQINCKLDALVTP